MILSRNDGSLLIINSANRKLKIHGQKKPLYVNPIWLHKAIFLPCRAENTILYLLTNVHSQHANVFEFSKFELPVFISMIIALAKKFN